MNIGDIRKELEEKVKLGNKLANAKMQVDTELQRVEGQIILLQDMIKREENKESGS